MTPYPYDVILSASSERPRDALFPGLWRAVLICVLLTGALFRLLTIGQDPIWLDEAYTYWFIGQSWDFLWHTMAGTETFPPLYYSMLKLWSALAGTSEIALRLPSAIAGILGIYGLAVAGRIAGGARHGPALGVMAATICALWQFQIHYAMEARPYSFGSLAVVLMLAGSARLLRDAEILRGPWRDLLANERPTLLGMIAAGTGLALAPWSHVVGAIPTLITGLYLLGWWALREKGDRAVLAKLLAVAGLAILLYLPNLRFVMTLGDRDMSGFWIEAPRLWKLVQITTQVYAQKVMNISLMAEASIMGLLILAGMVGFWRVASGAGRGGGAIFGLAFALMAGHWIGMTLLTYFVQPVILPRTLIFGQPATILLLAGLPWCLPRRARMAAGLTLAGYLGAGFLLHEIRLNNYAQYEQMTATIARSPDAAAPVVVMPGHFMLPFDYYAHQLPTPLNMRVFPANVPDFTHTPGALSTPDPTPDQIAALLDEFSDQPVIWLMMGNNMKNHQEVLDAFDAAGFERQVAVGTADYYPNLNYFSRSDDRTLAFGP